MDENQIVRKQKGGGKMEERKYKIGIVGLGLIGGSFARALVQNTQHIVYGFDLSENVLHDALQDGSVYKAARLKDEVCLEDASALLSECDLVFVALYVYGTVAFVKQYAHVFPKGCLVVDLCGLKEYVCESLAEYDGCGSHFTFIGGHPMAGREVAGYQNSVETLFQGASMILSPPASVTAETIGLLSELFYQVGFAHIEITDAARHDRIIAFTSQLAHVVSSAYIKSPTAREHMGFFAGSYQDMTRVAKMNEAMWSDLFILNRRNLISEIDSVIEHLEEYKNALRLADRDADLSKERINALIIDGTQIKKTLDES